MQVQLTPKEQARLARSQRTNSEAYDLYLRALVHVGLENRQDNQAAVELLEQAVARDPKFAPAYAALGANTGRRLLSSTQRENSGRRKRLPPWRMRCRRNLNWRKGTSRGVTCSGLSPTITLMKKPCRTSSARWH